MTHYNLTPRYSLHRQSGFTLLEVMVAIAVMSILLAVILVPLRMGFNSFNAGRARSEVQLQTNLALQQIAGDIKKSQFIFPNTLVPGISNSTNTAANCSSAPYKVNWKYLPYVHATASTLTDPPLSTSTGAGTYGACSSNVEGYSNPSRLDMLQTRRDNNGNIVNSAAGQDYIVSYYPRRLDVTQAYDIINNPIVLFRAQIPYRVKNSDGTPGTAYLKGAAATDYNALIDWTAYPATFGTCTAPQSNRSFAWITHSFYGEANLEPLCTTDLTGQNVYASHSQVTSRDMGLVAPQALGTLQDAYIPDLSFVEDSVSGTRIDRVTVNMTLARYDSSGNIASNGLPVAQRVRASQVVDVPNAGCSP